MPTPTPSIKKIEDMEEDEEKSEEEE